ncbi:MAG: bis(5'-nucleosyl)-tetraphosphatase (symmetrical) YqeK [Dehalococcoidia bacterium]|nr:bis(5'-nucleosyl)-tetraphosphatase (symmetrical) YqeK [Dehalococcoidia bacterium]
MSEDIRAQIGALQQAFEERPEGLLRHVQRVLVEALDLAERYDLDPERVELAVWGHDLFRSFAPADQLRLALECGLSLTAADRADPVLLHGPIAAVTMRERFGVSDEEALAAVRDHTLGAAEMPIIAKVILLADKFEKRKRDRTPVMKAIRRLAWRDLDTALLCWADWKWVQERENGWQSHPAGWAARLHWVAEHHAEMGLPAREPDEPTES